MLNTKKRKFSKIWGMVFDEKTRAAFSEEPGVMQRRVALEVSEKLINLSPEQIRTKIGIREFDSILILKDVATLTEDGMQIVFNKDAHTSLWTKPVGLILDDIDVILEADKQGQLPINDLQITDAVRVLDDFPGDIQQINPQLYLNWEQEKKRRESEK